MRWYGLLEAQVHICVQSMWKTRGVLGHAPLENFDFGPFIRRNLVESGTVLGEKSFSYLMKIAIESPQKLSDDDLETVVGIWTRKPRKIVV